MAAVVPGGGGGGGGAGAGSPPLAANNNQHSWANGTLRHAYHQPGAYTAEAPSPVEHVVEVVLRGSFTTNYWGSYDRDSYADNPIAFRPHVPNKSLLYPFFNTNGDPHDVHTIPFFRVLYAVPTFFHIPGETRRIIHAESDCVENLTAKWRLTMELDPNQGMLLFRVGTRSVIDNGWVPSHAVPFDQVLARMLFTDEIEPHLGDLPYDWAREFRVGYDKALTLIPNHDEIFSVCKTILRSPYFANTKIFAKTLNPFTSSRSSVWDASAAIMLLAEREGVFYVPALKTRLAERYPSHTLYGTVIDVVYSSATHAVDKNVLGRSHYHLHETKSLSDDVAECLLDFVALRYVCKAYALMRAGMVVSNTNLPRLLNSQTGRPEESSTSVPPVVAQLFPHALPFFITGGSAESDLMHMEYSSSALFRYLYHFVVTDPLPDTDRRFAVTRRVAELWLQNLAPYVMRRVILTHFLQGTADNIETQTRDDFHYMRIMNNSRKLNEIMVLVDGLRKALGVASSIDNGINLAVYDGDARVVKKYLSHLGAGGSGIADMVETYHFQLPIHTHNGQSQHLDARLPYERVALPDSMESLWDRRPSAPTQGRAAPAPPQQQQQQQQISFPGQLVLPNKLIIYAAKVSTDFVASQVDETVDYGRRPERDSPGTVVGTENPPPPPSHSSPAPAEHSDKPNNEVFYMLTIGTLGGLLLGSGVVNYHQTKEKPATPQTRIN